MMIRCSCFSVVLLIALLLQIRQSTSDLSADYSFSETLTEGYELYWNFNLPAETISFAVRVMTSGWVGFGFSPNGQMPGSDVVIGWVDSQSKVFFHDRYADALVVPSIDASQDWKLEFGKRENQYLILAFNRSFITCDPKDLDIETGTSRIIWSWNQNIPADANASSILQHENRGTTNLNLLGGLNSPPPEPTNAISFSVTSNVTIPGDSDTTYWCTARQLPEAVRNQTKYVYKISPVITENNNAYVHHIIVFLCSNLNRTAVNQGTVCENAQIDIQECRAGYLIGAWAIGGEDFVFPKDVAFAIGGPGAREYMMIEIHYNNPSLHQGVMDSSGLEFYYTDTKPIKEAGLVVIGHNVRPTMIIPPSANEYEIVGVCSGRFTKQFLPMDGITVFGSVLHTHNYGKRLRVGHLTENKECKVTEELKPLDENPRYDFNFQQTNHVPPVKVLPGDDVILQCFYNTNGTNQPSNPVLGGESTREEMCLVFLYYYPVTNMTSCGSFPYFQAYSTFAEKYIANVSTRKQFLDGIKQNRTTIFQPILNGVQWGRESIADLQQSTLNGPQVFFSRNDAGIDNGTSFGVGFIPSANCSNQPGDVCTGAEPMRCCNYVTPTPTPNIITTTPTNPSGGRSVKSMPWVLFSLLVALCVALLA